MKVVALISGGKDSCFNMIKAVEHGHEIVCLANLCPNDLEQQELDSFCFQTVGHNVVTAIGDAMELPLVRRQFSGVAVVKELHYSPNKDDEVEDLYELLLDVKNKFPEIEAVSCGAILSTYQRLRVESVCVRLGLKSLAYMWQRDQIELLNEMVKCKLNAILIKVASVGINPQEHLGKSLTELQMHFLNLSKKYGFQPCGEGGEYETFTLDCSLFKSTIVIDQSTIIETGRDVGHMLIEKYHLERKKSTVASVKDQKNDKDTATEEQKSGIGLRNVVETTTIKKNSTDNSIDDHTITYHGVEVKSFGQSRCAHWHSPLDVLALQAPCCFKYYACASCHDEQEDHALQPWPTTTPLDTPGLLCGVCKRTFSIGVYLCQEGSPVCPYSSCGAPFNPGCKNHWPIYFAAGLLERAATATSAPSTTSSTTTVTSTPASSLSLPTPSSPSSSSSPLTSSPLTSSSPSPSSPPHCSCVHNFVCCSETMGDTSSTLENEIHTMMKLMLKTLKNKYNCSASDIIYVNLHVTDMSLFKHINTIYCQYFGYNPPSRACVEILPYLPNNARCMIDCMGYINSGCTIGDARIPVARDVLHVQSISEWAPTCIGPYSQANILSGIQFQAGQIGLDPASMLLVQGGWLEETKQILLNMNAVLKSLKSNTKCIISCIIWINSNAEGNNTDQTNQTDQTKQTTNVQNGIRELVQVWLNGDQHHAMDKISFLYVPNLPRGAALEIQIIAMKNSMLIKGDGNDSIVLNWKQKPNKTKTKNAMVTDQENQHILHCNGVYLEHVLCIGRVLFESSIANETISVEKKKNTNNELVEHENAMQTIFQSAIEEIFQQLNNILIDSKLNWNTISQLQVYCCGDRTMHCNIRVWFANAWNIFISDMKIKLSLPALSFVPVVGNFMNIQIVMKAYNFNQVSTLVNESTVVSTIAIDLQEEYGDGDDDEEIVDVVDNGGGFAAAMAEVENGNEGEDASECSDMSDSDCDIFGDMPKGGIAVGSDEDEED